MQQTKYTNLYLYLSLSPPKSKSEFPKYLLIGSLSLALHLIETCWLLQSSSLRQFVRIYKMSPAATLLLFTPIALHLLYTPIAATWTVLTSSTTAPRSVADAVRRVLSLGHRHVDLLCCVMVNQLICCGKMLICCDKMKPKQNILHQSCR